MSEECGRAGWEANTWVVRWGPKHSRYGGVDYPCRGVDILPHGVDFEVGWSRFVFPLAMGGVDFWEVLNI